MAVDQMEVFDRSFVGGDPQSRSLDEMSLLLG